MTPKMILDKYKEMFPSRKDVIFWAPKGCNCILVELKNGVELMFTYHSDAIWSLKTL